MNLSTLQDDFNNVIKPQLEEILRLLKAMHAQDVTGNIEAAAAKVITELKPLIQNCHCNKELLQVLQQQELPGKEIIRSDDSPSSKSIPWRYSYPNSSVGNEEMGTGKNPGSLTWPFDADRKKTV